MSQKFLQNIALLLVINLLIKPFYILGIDAEVQNRVGQEVYGNYFSLLGLSFLLNILLDVGIVNFNAKNIAQNNHLVQKYFSHIVGLRIFLSFFYILFTLILAYILDYSFANLQLLGWLIFNQIIASFILYIRSNISGLHLFKKDSILSVLDRFLLLIICSLLLWGGLTKKAFQIEWFIYAQTFTYFITLLVALYLLLSSYPSSKIKLNKAFSVSIVKQSFPYALLILLMTIYYRADSVMIERMLPDGKLQAGIYANGFRFFEAANNIALLFATLLLPMFAKLIKEKTTVAPLVNIASRVLLSGAILITTICFFQQKEIIQARYNENLEYAAPVFGILMVCFFFISCTYIFGTLLTANGNLKTLNKIAFLGVLLNIILNLVFIPIYKAYGAALASLITQALTAIAQVYLCAKYFNFTFHYKLIASFILYASLLTIGYYIIHVFLNGVFAWYYLSFLLLVVGIVLIFLTQLIQKNHIKALFLSFKNNK